MLKKITTIILILLISLTSYIETNDNNCIEINNFNKENQVIIEKLIPNRGEQNIISTPDIKILYNSNYKLNNFKLYLNYKDITNKTIVTPKYIYYKCDKKLKRGVQVARLEIDMDNKSPQVIEWYFTVGTPFYKNYRGIFFNNTNNLNMLTSYDDLNSIYRYNKHFDYLFITEKFNNTTKKSIDNRKWANLINSCNKYSTNGDFISIPSFELSTKLKNKKSKTRLNIFNCTNPFIYKDNISLESFYKKLFYYDEDLIGQFKNNDSLNNINYFKYSPYGDEIISLIELKKEINNKDMKFNLDIYKEALDNGWHVSPIVCQYNEYDSLDINSNFITTILCEDLTKSQLLDGIKNRRIYISENSNIDISYSLNKMPMGSIIKNPSYIRIIVSAIANVDKDKIKKIQVFSNNNEIIYTKDFDSNFAKIDFTLKPPVKNTYYYAVITEKDNKQCITSPIWIEIS